MAEHSFQAPMSYSPLLLNYLCFDARYLQESRLATEVFIPAFSLGVCFAMATVLLQTRLKNVFCLFKKKISSR